VPDESAARLGLEWNEQLQRWHDHETGYDITLPVPPHDYLSTSCLHGLHERCAEKGARCKFCAAPCRCECHV